MTANTTKPSIPLQARLQPFGTIHRAGLSLKTVRRIERYRSKQRQAGAAVELVSWPDGVWCVLAMLPADSLPETITCRPPPLQAAVFDDRHKLDAYRDAKQMVRDGYLPLLTLSRDDR